MNLRTTLSATAFVALFPIVASAYPDVSASHRSATAIHTLQAMDIMRGYPDGSFGPDITLNRAELMKLLVESAEDTPDAEYYRDCFPDVRNEWYAPYVCYAAEQEWVGGYPDGTFQPGRAVNTAEAIKMLVESRDFDLVEPTIEAGTAPFGTGSWYAPYIATAIEEGIADSMTFRALWPDTPLSRSRAADFLYASMLSSADFISVVGSGCTASGITSVRLAYTKQSDVLSTTLQAQYQNGSECQLSASMNPYRTSVGGMDDLLSPILLPDPRIVEISENTFEFPLTEDGRAYFVHVSFDPYLVADNGEVWEYNAAEGTLTKLDIRLQRPFTLAEDLQTVAFVEDLGKGRSRLILANLGTGKRATVAELKEPQGFIALRGAESTAIIGGFGFGTGGTFTYGVHDRNQEKAAGDDLFEYKKVREETVDISTLKFQ